LGWLKNKSMDREITVEVDGEKYTGRYEVSRGGYRMITVMSAFGSKSTQLGGSTPEALAKLLLGELVGENKNRK